MNQESLDPHFFERAKQALSLSPKSINHHPPKTWETIGSEQHLLLGQKALYEGKVGCVVLAGGQGSRLGFKGPKGCAPVTSILNKSLFQLIAEKTVAASAFYQKKLLLGIMTSSCNDLETRHFFEKHHDFGLDPDQLFIFSQNDWPILDENGCPLINPNTAKPFLGPNGNGALYKAMLENQVLDAWEKNGVAYFNIILIDNPLADPYDAELIGFHIAHNDDLTIKCIERINPNESVGVIVWKDDRLFVVEYSELSPEEKSATTPTGTLLFPLANISLFASSMSFAKQRTRIDDLPLHAQKKNATPTGPLGWKIETYFFDHLKFTKNSHLVVYPRNEVFSPLKSKEGPHSFFEVRKALQDQDRRVWQRLTGQPAPETPFELSPFFFYPTESIKKRWQGVTLPLNDYVTPE